MDYEIRPLTLNDAERLQRYAATLFTEHPVGIFARPIPTVDDETRFIRSHVDSPNWTLLAAVRGDDVLGLIGFEGQSLAEERHAGVFGLSVDSEYRGHGIGTALLRALLAWAPGHGIRRIQAFAWANNPGAIALYERLGFVREGLCREAIMLDGEPVDVVLMAQLVDG